MLTEPDLQARYVAATLGVIETELQKLDLPTSNLRALFALVANASKVAAHLAIELERSLGANGSPITPSGPGALHGDNVIAFQAVNSAKR